MKPWEDAAQFETSATRFAWRAVPSAPTALVSLELAALLVEQGRTAEVKELATTTIPIFESLAIHDEAMAALLLFSEAVEREAVSVTLVRDIIVFLRQAEDDVSSAWCFHRMPAQDTLHACSTRFEMCRLR